MELELIRRYYSRGTNGIVLYKNKRVCFTIELPWQHNRPQSSCIPEGRYSLRKCRTSVSNWNLHVENVLSRNWILIQALQADRLPTDGCIAPVSLLVGPGRGILSNAAHRRLMAIVTPVLERNQPLYLTIKSK